MLFVGVPLGSADVSPRRMLASSVSVEGSLGIDDVSSKQVAATFLYVKELLGIADMSFSMWRHILLLWQNHCVSLICLVGRAAISLLSVEQSRGICFVQASGSSSSSLKLRGAIWGCDVCWSVRRLGRNHAD
jgi:hypothetical protein